MSGEDTPIDFREEYAKAMVAFKKEQEDFLRDNCIQCPYAPLIFSRYDLLVDRILCDCEFLQKQAPSRVINCGTLHGIHPGKVSCDLIA